MHDINQLQIELQSLKVKNDQLSVVVKSIDDLVVAYNNKEITDKEFIELANNIQVESIVLSDSADAANKEELVSILKQIIFVVGLA